MNTYALIFAGGVGRRMGSSPRPKQFLELSGRPIIDYTIEHFAEHPRVDRMVVVCLKGWIGYLRAWLSSRHYDTPIDVVPGGDSGQESIFNGLRHLHGLPSGDGESIVLVHDGVRPLIDGDTISRCIDSVVERGCTATIAPAIETIVVADGQAVRSIIPRDVVGLARAPQGFVLEELYGAHLRARDEGVAEYIDSISLMSHFGYEIHTVEGPAENIKVTTPMDYFAFKGYMEARDQRLLWV